MAQTIGEATYEAFANFMNGNQSYVGNWGDLPQAYRDGWEVAAEFANTYDDAPLPEDVPADPEATNG